MLGVLEQRRHLLRWNHEWIPRVRQQLRRLGVAERERVCQPVQSRAAFLFPDGLKLSSYRGVALGDLSKPGLRLGSHGLGRWGFQRSEDRNSFGLVPDECLGAPKEQGSQRQGRDSVTQNPDH